MNVVLRSIASACLLCLSLVSVSAPAVGQSGQVAANSSTADAARLRGIEAERDRARRAADQWLLGERGRIDTSLRGTMSRIEGVRRAEHSKLDADARNQAAAIERRRLERRRAADTAQRSAVARAQTNYTNANRSANQAAYAESQRASEVYRREHARLTSLAQQASARYSSTLQMASSRRRADYNSASQAQRNELARIDAQSRSIPAAQRSAWRSRTIAESSTRYNAQLREIDRIAKQAREAAYRTRQNELAQINAAHARNKANHDAARTRARTENQRRQQQISAELTNLRRAASERAQREFAAADRDARDARTALDARTRAAKAGAVAQARNAVTTAQRKADADRRDAAAECQRRKAVADRVAAERRSAL